MNQLLLRELKSENEWESPQQAVDTLEKFCIFLNYYFQGYSCDMELDDVW